MNSDLVVHKVEHALPEGTASLGDMAVHDAGQVVDVDRLDLSTEALHALTHTLVASAPSGKYLWGSFTSSWFRF